LRLNALSVVGILALVVVLRLAVMPELGYEGLFQRGVEAASGLGLLAAAIAFDRGDPPRRPWATVTAALLLVPLARAASALELTVGQAMVGHILLILSNILCIAALLGFRSMLISTGLTPEWTTRGRIRAVLIAAPIVAASIALVSYHLTELGDFSLMTTTDQIGSSVLVVSIIADAIILAVGLLLVRLVQPMLGGSVALPYILVAVGGGLLLFVDVFSVVLKVTTQDLFSAPVPIALATLAWTSFALAGLAQRQLVRSR